MQRMALVMGLVAASVSGAGGGAGSTPPETKRVAGRAVMHASICRGGVAVTQEDIDRLPPPQPLGGKEFLVVAGNRISAAPPVARFTTRGDGTFATRLPPGQWCFFEASRRPNDDRPRPIKTAPAGHVDPGCLEEQRRRCDLVLQVKADVRHAEIIFTERCPQAWAQPCYHGPMPP